MTFTIINKENVAVKFKILENNKVKKVIKLYNGSTQIDVSKNINVTIVVKKLDNYLFSILKYILFHLNGVVDVDLSKIFRYEKITFFSIKENITMVYTADHTILLGCDQYTYENKYHNMLGMLVVILLSVMLILVLCIYFLIL